MPNHEYAIRTMAHRGEYLVIEVDTTKATYREYPWKTLGDWGKRKFENLLVLKYMPERVKVLYV